MLHTTFLNIQNSSAMVGLTPSLHTCTLFQRVTFQSYWFILIIFQEAETRINLIARGYYKGEPASKLSIQPITGRRHQIRVHCSDIGHPIVGDYTYSGKTDKEPDRMMLHSWKLEIPLKNNPIKITSLDPFLCTVEPDIVHHTPSDLM